MSGRADNAESWITMPVTHLNACRRTTPFPNTTCEPPTGDGPATISYRVGTLVSAVFCRAVTEADLHVELGDTAHGYQVILPVTGWCISRHRGTKVTATPELAAVYRPDGGAELTHWPAGSELLRVKFDRTAVHNALRDLIGRPLTEGLSLAAELDTGSGAGRQWARHVAAVEQQLHDHGGLHRHPLVALPLLESVLYGFLLATAHQYSGVLLAPARAAAPTAVRRAVDIIEADPTAPLTVTVLASRVNVSVRTLQAGFVQHVGVSPMAYLRGVRLRHVHRALLAADPGTSQVQSIAAAWGFTHLGRFAALYRQKYGCAPSHTLHAGSSPAEP